MDREPSTERLERLIERRSKRLPSWWAQESLREERDNPPPIIRVPLVRVGVDVLVMVQTEGVQG